MTQIAQTFDGQRRMLNLLADAKSTGARPCILEIASNLQMNPATARRCLAWLEVEGFVTVTRRSKMQTDVELIRNPGDDELRTAIEQRRTS